MSKPTCVIVDIDGTQADLTHRLHFLQKKPKDYDGFFAAAPGDSYIHEVIEVVRGLDERGHVIINVTGRPERTRKATEEWLFAGNAPCDYMFMRPEKDYREDTIIKEEILMREILPNYTVVCVIDDRANVVEMWRRHGLRVLQVAKGNY